ncbi:MAG: MBL fold metallo-hydrolase [bacterium]|nr:MBL fold metallo-hydrolase [bacterium]
MKYLISLLGLALAVVWLAIVSLPDDYLHIVFCNVGQGDATLISYKTTQLLIDGGPNDQVLGCLDRYLPFYDRRLEAVIMTHPQADHLTGLIEVFKRYQVLAFIRSDVANQTAGYRRLMESASSVPMKLVSTGDVVRVGDKINFQVIWPPANWQGDDLNTYSVGGQIAFGQVDFLFTGDADSPVDLAQIATGLLSQVEVLKVPHHGSKTAMIDEWIKQVSPQLAVIEVGKNNRFGHPRPEALHQLEEVGAKILRTDLNGEVEVITDGSKWWYNLEYGN